MRLRVLAVALFIAIQSSYASAAAIFIDFTSTTVSDAGWNRLNVATNGGAGVTLDNLIDDTSTATNIDVAITSRFGGRNTNGTTNPTGDAAQFADATDDSGYGNGAGTFSSQQIRSSQVTFTDLNPYQLYDFTFFGSRTGVTAGENRQTQYDLLGLTTSTTYLDAANNTSQVATLLAVQPDATGTIVLNLRDGPDNTNSYKFFYLGAMKITPGQIIPEPASLACLALGGLTLLRRRRH